MADYYRHALPVGEIVGDYEVVSVLGAGGFGVTYLVKHRTMGDRFAMKEYFPQSLAERENSGTVVIRTNTFEDTYYRGLHGFLEEAKIVRRLRGHPNVVHVNTFFEINNTAYMVMEYYSGQTVTAFKRQCGDSFDEASLRRVIAPVLDALEYVHQREVVHRDIKPDNIFLCEDGRPILLDFGASRFAAAGGTVPMTAVLTPGFAPPEQYISAEGGETILRQGPWTDLYALGATLHMLACDRAPYDAMSRQMSGPNDPQPPAATRLPGYSAAFCRTVDACLRLDMKARPQSVAEFRALWNDTVTAEPGSAPPRAPTSAPPVSPPVAPPSAVTGPRPPISAAPTGTLPPPPAAVTRESIPAAAALPVAAKPGSSRAPLFIGIAAVLLAAAGGAWWLLRPAPVVAPVAGQGLLLVFTDTRCELKLNGTDKGVLEAGQSLKIDVMPGEQAVECVGTEDAGMSDWQTETVAAGQQAVVELVLASADQPVETGGEPDPATSEDPGTEVAGDDADNPWLTMPSLAMLPPDFQEAVTDVPTGGVISIRQLSVTPADAADDETWFASNGLSLEYAQGASSLAPKPSWTGGFEIPDFVLTEFDGQKLLKVINSDPHIISLYGEDFSSARLLVSQNIADGTPEYMMDFSEYAQAPQRIEADRDFVGQQIVWAQQVDNMLYVSHGHNTYARSSYGKTGYITAINLGEDFVTAWHSPALVSNAGNFVVYGDHIISGYGFTDEPDFLYVLDRNDGNVVNRLPLSSGPSFLVLKDQQLFVRVYDKGYVFSLE